MSDSADGSNAAAEQPLFPLQRVLFPGVSFPLRIFEQRYLRLVRESLAAGTGFGVVPILAGREVGAPPTVARRGTWARITDWSTLPNGLLGIEIRGERRLVLGATRVAADGLLLGEVALQPAEAAAPPLTEAEADLVALLDDLARHLGVEAACLGDELDTGLLGWRLADLLPVAVERKIALLAVEDPVARLGEVRRWVAELAGRGAG
jgi:uncharacterized protein